MSDGDAAAAALAPVPGIVKLVTTSPVVMPASAAQGESSLAEQLSERPWLLAVGFIGLLGFFLLVRARRSD